MRPGTFHFQGLLPWGARRAWVVAPNVFSPTKWCRRKLTDGEVLRSLDIPGSVLSLLDGRRMKSLLQATSVVPSKCLLTLLNTLLGQLSVVQENPISFHSNLLGPNPSLGVDRKAASASSLIQTRMEHEAELERKKVATKADDAKIPVYLWDERIQCALPKDQKRKFLEGLRILALRWW